MSLIAPTELKALRGRFMAALEEDVAAARHLSKKEMGKVRSFSEFLYLGRLKHVWGEMIRHSQAD